MKHLDEIIFDAIMADADLVAAVGGPGQIESTCFEVSPLEDQDNTPVPYLLVMNDGLQNNVTTKDYVWEGPEDGVTATVEIAGREPREVTQLLSMVRRAVEHYIVAMSSRGEYTPQLESLQAGQLQWDWTKPCYYQHLTYTCTIRNDEQD